ncbi:cell envelope integrity protein TolA [Pandoraea commovens]|uniref:Uncharacterized protein n=1 Tax=Pandoraea commovens TaxID=2508289 RepID=A0ABY5QL93_9BURK|nr:cell envelope integrity protein TolA [Pandoraea commovens]UVA81582.1 hypothetical protein NTU39_11555 [Pandoraea commovens]
MSSSRQASKPILKVIGGGEADICVVLNSSGAIATPGAQQAAFERGSKPICRRALSAKPFMRPGSIDTPPPTPLRGPSDELDATSLRTRPSSDFIASTDTSNSVPASARTWPSLKASNSLTRVTDLMHTWETPTAPDVATSNDDLPKRLSRTPSSISEISVVPASLPERRRHVSESAVPTDKRHEARAFFAIGGLFATVSKNDLRPSALSARGARYFGLPPKPQYRPYISGVVSQNKVESGEGQADAKLVSVELSNIVDGVPFEKSVVGVHLMNIGNIVVRVDAEVFYATSTLSPGATQVRLRRLDSDNRNDQQKIEKYLAFKRRLKTDAMMKNPPITAVNVARGFTQRAGSPEMEAVRAALETLTSPVDLTSYVEDCRADLRSRQRFDPYFHKRDLDIYRTLLGDDLVFKENGQWNLSHDAGVADIRTHLMNGNLAFAVVGAESGVNVYFATSDSERLEGLRLHIHEAIGDEDAVTIGDITYIDAKRRLERITKISNAPGPSRARINLPTLTTPSARQPERFRDAEQIIAAVIEHDMRDDPIITSIHFNSLLDTCDSCAVALRLIGKFAGQDISFVYHRDYGVMSRNSEDRRIRMLKQLATSANRMRDALINDDYATLHEVSRTLLAPEMLGVIASTLRISSMSPARPNIYPVANALYLHLLASLIREEATFAHDTVAMLRSDEGKIYVALVGYRIRNDQYLARAWCTLMRELTLSGISAEALQSILLARANQHLRSFWQELLSARSTTRGNHLDQVYYLLKQDDLNPSLTNARRVSGLLKAVHLRVLRYFKVSRHAPAKMDRSYRARKPIPEVLEAIRRVISEESVIELERERLRSALSEAMPTMTVGEQRKLRDMVTTTVNEAWRKELPGESPPSEITQSVLASVGPRLGRHLTELRGPAIREIIDETIRRYGEHLYRHPNATEEQMAATYREHLTSASTRYAALLADDVPRGTPSPSGEQPEIESKLSTEARIVSDREARKAARAAEHAAAWARAEAATKARTEAQQAVASTSNYARVQAQDRAKEEARQAAIRATTHANRKAMEDAKKAAIIKSQREAREAAERIARDRIRAATDDAKRQARMRAVAIVKERIAARKQANTSAGGRSGRPSDDVCTESHFETKLSILRYGEIGALERLKVESGPIGDAKKTGEASGSHAKVALTSKQ